MYYLRSGTRMLQGRQNTYKSTFTLHNTRLQEQAEIGAFAAWLIRSAYKIGSFEILEKTRATRAFLHQLIDMGFICEGETIPDSKSSTIYLGKKLNHHFPLTAFNIELTNMCNLHCKHCYGSFPNTIKPEFVPFEWIKHSLNDFNRLHVRKIALTGGEATTHPQFLDIALFLIEHGFDVCVFTNGYNYNIIEELLEKSKDYHLTIKVSLDGIANIHDQIRGKKNSYLNAIKTIELASKFSNVTLYISTSVLRQNIDSISELDKEIIEHFPDAIHTKDLAFPLGNASTCAFSIDELLEIDKKIPNLFIRHGKEEASETISLIPRQRCTGGVSQCTLMPDGNLKNCNAACDKQFYFKHNAYAKGLQFAWINCGKLVNKFRHEKPRATNECKHCQNQQVCKGSNCRVLAWVYTGSAKKSNPLTCFSTRKMTQE